MPSAAKNTQDLARKLFKLSFDNGQLSAERVGGVLEYVEKHSPANPMSVLKAYHRLVAAEVARGQALVEHAGSVSDATMTAITGSMSQKYGRPVSSVRRSNPQLIAGLRVRIGDDIYESSVAGQLADLATTV